MGKNNMTDKKFLGKGDYRLGVICGALVVWSLLLVLGYNELDWDDVCDSLSGIGGVLILMPLAVVLAISVLYVRRRMHEWKDKPDQIAPAVKGFLGCALRLLLLGVVFPISIWFVGRDKIRGSSFQRPYEHIDRKPILDALETVSSTSDISNAFAQFPTEREGYESCKKWLKKMIKKGFKDRVRAVFIAYCFRDKKFCDSYFYGDGWVCDKWGAVQLLDMFCHSGDDPKVVAFIARYTNSSDKAKKAYAEMIPWGKYVDSDDEVAYRFYMALGIKPKYSDQYSYRRNHRYLHGSMVEDTLDSYNGATFGIDGWQSEEYETNLSRAVKKNDIKSIEKLLKWGCDPNQYLKIEAESPTIPPLLLKLGLHVSGQITLAEGFGRDIVKSNHIIKSDHIINLVTSRVTFDLLVAAGMDANPPSSISYVNGEVKVSNTTDGCRFL